MEVDYIKNCDSTQNLIIQDLKQNGFKKAYAIVSNEQKQAIASRGNSWESLQGNLFLSFCDELKNYDVPLQSFSIYFALILNKTLKDFGSKAFVKWPNDIYLENRKIGGIMTNIIKSYFVCGIGLNLIEDENYANLDIFIDKKELVKAFFANLALKLAWQELLEDFKKEFYKSQNFSTTINNEKVSLKEAKLNFDGSIILNEEKISCKR